MTIDAIIIAVYAIENAGTEIYSEQQQKIDVGVFFLN